MNRLKNTNTEKFQTMCKMHLSFLLDLPGASLEDLMGEGSSSSPGPSEQQKQQRMWNFPHFGKRKVKGQWLYHVCVMCLCSYFSIITHGFVFIILCAMFMY